MEEEEASVADDNDSESTDSNDANESGAVARGFFEMIMQIVTRDVTNRLG